jgi:predicted phosphodiesterase
MLVAVLSDIHGNHYALKNVLEEAKEKGIEKLIILGDIIGYYYHPDLVLSLIGKWDCELIRGNHEKLILSVLNKEITIESLYGKYGSGHKIAIEKLNSSELNRLINLPDFKNLKICNSEILMCHGSNWDSDFYLYPDTSKEVLNKSSISNNDFVFVGHSHYPFVHHNLSNTLINVGSVGQSRKKGGVANWLFLNTETKSYEIMNTLYDTGPLIQEVEKMDPEIFYLKNILMRNEND